MLLERETCAGYADVVVWGWSLVTPHHYLITKYNTFSENRKKLLFIRPENVHFFDTCHAQAILPNKTAPIDMAP